VRELLEIAFGYLELNWSDHVVVDATFVRAPEGSLRIGDASRAKADLGWEPRTGFEELVVMMVRADLERLKHS
jgi:GDPmannose 4,6-dehydratase